MSPVAAHTVAAVLQRALGEHGAEPLVTFYDEATGERVELSFTTYANWVAKTASLLQDELDVVRGSRVVVDLPTHWLGPVWLGAAWALGASVSPGDTASDPSSSPNAEVVVCGPASLEHHARTASGHVVACSLLPLGARFTTPPAAPVIDFGDVVWSQPDALLVLDPPQGSDAAWQDASGTLTQADLTGLAGATSRVLSTAPATSRTGVAVLLGALSSGHGVVWVTDSVSVPPGRERLEALAGAERAHLLG